MSRPRAVVASLDYWTSPFQLGGHHIARGLVREGWDVAYVSWPISPFHLLSGRRDVLRHRFDIYRRGGLDDLNGHLWAYVPGALATPYHRPLLRSEWLHRNWPTLSMPRLARMLRGRGFGSVALLYLDVPIHRRLLDDIHWQRSVLRIPDRLAGFRHLAPAMQVLEREAAGAVDVVAYTARSLESHARALGARGTLHLPNGVDVEHFRGGNRSQPSDLAEIPRPIAIYVGAMDAWFDYPTLDRMTAELPGVSFVLIGPDEVARERLTSRSNLHLLGRRPYATLPGYLAHADVGLIPFDAADHPELVESIHPLKLYEYLAAGLPVVATYWSEIASLGSPAILCRTADEHVAAIRRVLAERPDPSIAVTFAAGASWQSRVRSLIEALDL
jgi:glycosyltransferase involved in cell wall biosynthesis